MTHPVTRLLPAVVVCLVVMAGQHDVRAQQLPPHWEESGMASWYGGGFDGRRTSSGDRFDANALTAAHDTLPLGTRIRVTTQETGQSVVVVVTDRMPPKHSRIIDLSRAAAKQLGLLYSGTGMVTLTEAHADDPEAEPVEVAEAPDDIADPEPGNRFRRKHFRIRAAAVHHRNRRAHAVTIAGR